MMDLSKNLKYVIKEETNILTIKNSINSLFICVLSYCNISKYVCMSLFDSGIKSVN